MTAESNDDVMSVIEGEALSRRHIWEELARDPGLGSQSVELVLI